MCRQYSCKLAPRSDCKGFRIYGVSEMMQALAVQPGETLCFQPAGLWAAQVTVMRGAKKVWLL